MQITCMKFRSLIYWDGKQNKNERSTLLNSYRPRQCYCFASFFWRSLSWLSFLSSIPFFGTGFLFSSQLQEQDEFTIGRDTQQQDSDITWTSYWKNGIPVNCIDDTMLHDTMQSLIHLVMFSIALFLVNVWMAHKLPSSFVSDSIVSPCLDSFYLHNARWFWHRIATVKQWLYLKI